MLKEVSGHKLISNRQISDDLIVKWGLQIVSIVAVSMQDLQCYMNEQVSGEKKKRIRKINSDIMESFKKFCGRNWLM